MCAVHLDIAIGTHDEYARSAKIACQVEQQIERASIGVVQVFEHEQQWSIGGCVGQESDPGLEQSTAIVLRIPGWRRF